MKFTKYWKILLQRRKKISSSPEKLCPNIPRYRKHLTNPLALVQEGGTANSFEVVTAIVRLKKKGYLSSVPMGGIQDPYNVGNHYYGRYAYTGYGGRVPEERLMHGQKHDCQHSTTRDVSSGPTSFLLSTNDKYTNDAP